MPAERGHADLIQRLLHSILFPDAQDAALEVEQLAHSNGELFVDQIRRLRHIGRPAEGAADGTVQGLQETEHELDQGAFAAAVFTDDCHIVPILDGHGQVPEQIGFIFISKIDMIEGKHGILLSYGFPL